MQRSVGSFFTQKMTVGVVTEHRTKHFQNLCRGKRVLHIGCADAPIFNARTNLHIALAPHCDLMHGLDLDAASLEKLSSACPGTYFASYAEIPTNIEYDLVLIPEVIEHVANIELFLKDIQSIRCKTVLITAPNVEGNYKMGYFGKGRQGTSYIETVHPDHNMWFSPYTLANCIEKFTSWKIDSVFTIANDTMVACLCTVQ